VTLEDGASGREEVAGVEEIVAQKLEEVPVELVGARLRGGVVSPAGALVLGGIGILLYAKFLQRVDRRLNPSAALVLLDRGSRLHHGSFAAATARNHTCTDRNSSTAVGDVN